jgi:hypothetical protein
MWGSAVSIYIATTSICSWSNAWKGVFIMNILRKGLTFLLTLGTVSSAMAAQEPGHARRIDGQPGLIQSEGKEDPQGLLNQQSLDSLRQLAVTLTSDRSWLTSEVLEGLNSMSIFLDEVFSAAPEFVEVDGKLYRLALEKVGDGWESFAPRSSRYLIFLNHEVYDGLGENYALGFETGKERVLVKEDIAKVASIGLTLRGIAVDEKPNKGSQGVVDINTPIQLGKVRPRFRGPKDQKLSTLLNGVQASKSCAYTAAPVACSFNGAPLCSSGTASPFFVLNRLMIKTDHEGAFKGDPETELFPLRVNTTSPLGGSSNVRTSWIFSGRYVTDLAGRSVYLPDVDNSNQWYTISGDGLALFPASLSNQWVGTLVENDDDTGLLELDRNRTNPIKTQFTYDSTKKFDFFDLLVGVGQLIITLAFQSDSDDLWIESLEVSNSRFCSEGVGQSYPYNFLFDAQEWAMQGHFACIDPACAPDPCGGDPCCGDPCCGGNCCGSGWGFPQEICPIE